MPAPVKVKNAADAFVNEDKPETNFGDKVRLYIRNSTGVSKQPYIFFDRPFPYGVTIISAKLQVYPGEGWGTSTTLTAQRVASKWGVNRIKWANKPAVTGSTATLTKASSSADSLWEIDVTALMQEVANGGAWYGFRLITNRAAGSWLHSAQATKAGKRPVLVIQWSATPDAPDNLQPAGGRSVSTARPVLTWDFNDSSGEEQISAARVIISANADLSSPVLDTGWQAVSNNQMDDTVAAYAAWSGIPNAATRYWNVAAKDTNGIASPSSEIAVFGRTDQGVLAFTDPAADGNIFDHRKVVSWSLTGATQAAYQLWVADADSPNEWLWDTGKITATTSSEAIEEGVLKFLNKNYIIGLRVWDTSARQSTPGSKAYLEVTRTVSLSTNGAITGVTGMSATSDPVLPVEHLTWSRATEPDFWAITRSEDSGVTWEYIDYVEGSALLVSGTNYAYDDPAASPYTPYQWQAHAVVGGQQSVGTAVTGEVRRLAPFLMRRDGTDACCFLNPQRERKFLDKQAIVERISGPPVLVTQRMGLRAGSVSGRLTGEALVGVTALQMKKRFDSIRDDPGTPVVVVIANESIKARAYNMQYDILTDTSGITYQASFDWIEVP
jgi:hypothetical protein